MKVGYAVSSIMAKDIVSVETGTPLIRAIKTMVKENIGSVLVTTEGSMVGIPEAFRCLGLKMSYLSKGPFGNPAPLGDIITHRLDFFGICPECHKKTTSDNFVTAWIAPRSLARGSIVRHKEVQARFCEEGQGWDAHLRRRFHHVERKKQKILQDVAYRKVE